MHLLDYVKVLYKRRWTAVTIFLLVVGSVTVYTFTATPIFEAQDAAPDRGGNQNVVSFKAVLDGDQTRADYYQTQYNILQSRALARRTLDELKLWDTPPFGGETDAGLQPEADDSRRPGALVVGRAALQVRRPSPASESAIPGADETAAQSRAIDAFAANLTVAPIRNSRLVDRQVSAARCRRWRRTS